MAAPTRTKRPRAPTTAAVQPPEPLAPGYWTSGTRADDSERPGRIQHRAYTQLELEALERRAWRGRLEDELRKCGKSYGRVLRDHGLIGDGQGGPNKGRSPREFDEIADLWINWRTDPTPGPATHGLLRDFPAACGALAEGREMPAPFQTDCDTPLGVEDAICNMQRFLGRDRGKPLERKSTLKVLRQIDDERAARGLSRLEGLPPKVERKRRAKTAS